jgi:hypothetical protein
MPGLIKLTIWDLNRSEEETGKILVNPAHIVMVRTVYGKTEIVLSDSREILVFENLDLIHAMIRDL